MRSDEGVSLQLFRNTKRNEKTCVRACKTNEQDAYAFNKRCHPEQGERIEPVVKDLFCCSSVKKQ